MKEESVLCLLKAGTLSSAFVLLALADVVAEDVLLIAEVEFSIGNGWMRPDLAVSGSLVGLGWYGESALFDPFFWIGFNQDTGSLVFAKKNQMAVGTGDGTLAEFL